MLDRASTFAQPEIVDLLKTRFVPVAIDQAYQRRQKDTEGEFYRRIASQSPRNNFESTTQGFYIATARGELLLYNNNRDPAKLLRLMKQKLADFESSDAAEASVAALQEENIDPRYNVTAPEGGLVVRVHTQVLDGYPPTTNRWQRIFQTSIARDNLWLTAGEHRAIARGELPETVKRRIARYHLVDNTRGEPPMWRANEIRELKMTLQDGEIRGEIELATDDNARGYHSELRGEVKVTEGRVTTFDIVVLGNFWGEGRYTRNAPPGKFPLAVVLTLADDTHIADRVPPQGSRGWVDGYLDAK